MRAMTRARRRFVFLAMAATGGLALAVQGAAGAAVVPRPPAPGGAWVAPRTFGELDCNGLSPIQRPVKANLACADPRGAKSWGGRFYENGAYIGHDEPTVRFLSSQRGSGASTTFTERLPVDPKARPTVAHPGGDVTHWFELSVAPWFSTDVCDSYSSPLLPCHPVLDGNAPRGKYPGAGAAFVELQFYPPGFAPFVDNESCDDSHWCSALTIDSLECAGSGINVGPCNNNCVEPVNFAFIQTNGVPPGPPSPQLSDLATFTPDSHTLLMNPGDTIRVQLFDAAARGGGHALEARETDLTTHTSGFMVASAANGFMHTNPFTCKGRPYSFQPEYSSARPANILPWGIGPYMINSEFEIGHFEPCRKVTGAAKISLGSFTDTYYRHCAGPYDTGAENSSLEPNDSPCYPAGDTHGGTAAPNLVTGCDVFFGAIGDLDYDGTNYYPDWPVSASPGRFPSSFLQRQPTTVGGSAYPLIQFETDASATEFNTNCNLTTGAGCVLPPKGPGHFYPYWTQAKVGGVCVWEFGNVRSGDTFGGDAQYGKVTPTSVGAFTSPIRKNPAC